MVEPAIRRVDPPRRQAEQASPGKFFRRRGSLSRTKAPIYNEGQSRGCREVPDAVGMGDDKPHAPETPAATHMQEEYDAMMAILPSSSLPPAPLTVTCLVPTPRRVLSRRLSADPFSRRPAILSRGGRPILFLSLAAIPRPEEDGDTVASYIYTVSRKFGLVYFPSYSVQFLVKRWGPC